MDAPLDLPPEILHLPYEPGPYRMAMALRACPAEELVELDNACPAQLAERLRLLDARPADVLAALPEARHASAELAAHLLRLLPARFPGHYMTAGNGVLNRLTGETLDVAKLDPLHLVGRLVAEDFCLLAPSASGPVLVGAVLCFPARWVLAEKLGKPLLGVHERVPGYAERLGRPVDRFIAQLKPGRVALRLNWSVIDDPALFQRTGKFRDGPDAAITATNALGRLYLRVERQTFLLLERSATVAFGIRTHVTPLSRVVALEGEAARLAAAVRALPAEMALYKSLGRFRDALLAALDHIQVDHIPRARR